LDIKLVEVCNLFIKFEMSIFTRSRDSIGPKFKRRSPDPHHIPFSISNVQICRNRFIRPTYRMSSKWCL